MCSRRYCAIFVVLYTILSNQSATASTDQKRLHILTVLNGDNPLFGYYGISPMYDVAIEKILLRYPHAFRNMSRTTIHQPGLFGCPDGAAMIPTLAEKIYEAVQLYPDHFPVIFFPGCSLEVLAMGDFAREWDIPLLAAISGDMALADKQRYPTVVTFPAPDHVTMPASFQLFAEKYQWRTITFLCDGLSQLPAVATFYMISCSNIKRKLDASTNIKYQTYKFDFDSKFSQDYETLLKRMQPQSRVAIIFSHPRIVRDIMVTAYLLNMTSGDYIFFTSQTTRVPQTTDMLWKFADGNDEAAFDGFRSVISFVNPNPSWDRVEDILEEVKNITLWQYNRSISRNDQLNDLAISAYESVAAFAQIINQTEPKDLNTLTGRQFAKKFWGRSFDFPSRSFFIGPNGMRVNDVIYSRLNTSSGIVEDTWRYYASSRTLIELKPDLAKTWRDKNGPPPDIPVCGFRNDLCVVSNLQAGIVIGVGVAVALLALIGLSGVVYWKIVELDERKNLWWYVNQSGLTIPEESRIFQDPLANKSKMASEKNIAGISSRWLYQKQAVVLEQFKEQSLPAEQILERKTLRHVLHLMKHFHHDNVAKFIGITTGESPMGSYLVFEYGARGTLRMLLQNDRIQIDQSLQSSMIWEIIGGLKYIHNSSLHHHGMLSSLGIMMDKRFCIKLSSYALAQFRSQFNGNIFPQGLPLHPAILWAAPEIIAATTTGGSREGDIYSIGVIISEIFTTQTPLSTNFNNSNSIRENIAILQEKPEKRRTDDSSKVPKKLQNVITSCVANVISERPSLTQLTGKLTHTLSRQKLVDSIMRRLEHYANDLENTVEARTHDLLEERHKVDSLLKEMLPATLINKLRNKETVNTEDFDCVTILFSDIPQFAPICAQSAPLQTIILLNTIYSIFDLILPKFDAYKVETINDSYLVASGLPIRNGINHASEIARMGLAMRDATETIRSPLDTTRNLQLRVGINSGHCAAGVVGLRMPRYCLFGDTINTASRMESHGAESKVHLSSSAKDLLDQTGGFTTEPRGSVVIKGKGEMVTYWLLSAV